MNRKKKIIMIGIILVILLMAIGYAALSNAELKINSNAKATTSTFKVCFDHTQEPVVRQEPAEKVTVNAITPAEGATEIPITFEGFKDVGDKANITFAIVNAGDIAATDVSAIIKKVDETVKNDIVADNGIFQFELIKSPDGITLAPGAKVPVTVQATLIKQVSTEAEKKATCSISINATPSDV